MNLKSSVEQQGKYVTQILHFSHGNKRTFEDIDTSTIKQGEFTKMKLKDGRMLFVNTPNVDCIEVFPQEAGNYTPPRTDTDKADILNDAI